MWSSTAPTRGPWLQNISKFSPSTSVDYLSVWPPEQNTGVENINPKKGIRCSLLLKRKKNYPGLQSSLPFLALLKRQLSAPQPQQASPSSSSSLSSSHLSSTSAEDHLSPLLRGTRSNKDSNWDCQTMVLHSLLVNSTYFLFLCETCIVIKSISIGTNARISDSHWVHNQVLTINNKINSFPN